MRFTLATPQRNSKNKPARAAAMIEHLEDRRLLSAVYTTMATRATFSRPILRAAGISPSNVSTTQGFPSPNLAYPYTATGTFTDPDSTSWVVDVDYGTGLQVLNVTSHSFTLSHQYTTAGPYSVLVEVADAEGNTSGIIQVDSGVIPNTTNATPSAPVITQGTPPPNQNHPLLATGTFMDPDSKSWTVSTDFGDGTAVQNQSVTSPAVTSNPISFNLSHSYATAGNKTVSVTVTDAQGNVSPAGTLNLTVPGLAVTAGPDQTLTEPNGHFHDTTDGSFGDFSPGPWTATVNYGDGSATVPLAFDATTHTFTYDHQYDTTTSASYNVVVTVKDTGTSKTATDTFAVNTVNVGPSNIQLVPGPQAKISSTPYTATGTFTDPGSTDGSGGAAIDAWTVKIDYGDGSQGQTLRVTQPSFSLSHLYNRSGNFVVTVAVTDKGGLSTTATFAAAVAGPNNPVVNAGADVVLKEGHTTLMKTDASFVDLVGGPWNVSVDFGDQTPLLTFSLNSTGQLPELTHTYPSGFNHTYTATIYVGTTTGAGTDTFKVSTKNNKPNNLTIVSPKTRLPTTSQRFSATASFADSGAGRGDFYRVYVDYGDDSHVFRASTQHNKFGITHQYTHPGTYTVTVQVFDAAGAGITTSETVRVTAAKKKKKPAAAISHDREPAPLPAFITDGSLTD